MASADKFWFPKRRSQGTLIEVLDDLRPGATAAYCRPIDHDGLEAIFVPEEDRSAEEYDGYTIVLPVAAVDHAWRKVGC